MSCSGSRAGTKLKWRKRVIVSKNWGIGAENVEPHTVQQATVTALCPWSMICSTMLHFQGLVLFLSSISWLDDIFPVYCSTFRFGSLHKCYIQRCHIYRRLSDITVHCKQRFGHTPPFVLRDMLYMIKYPFWRLEHIHQWQSFRQCRELMIRHTHPDD